ncbi:hypothetical protein Xmau_03033 [Xenorhabdus mauleonii]|uniref:Uncharacterized protein n=1 Tax=Xenorhabdus mauleonii TaxID=351675 RepID=A0A1I3SCQ9_9GAMM|nr:hypothetical protein [Xenorhabdus mauleonii]PHM39128.1 hypothetical protein Xmau_03033 [Xenorhabdus mauleonii]SFJ56180.1 hypothetical protein SAMN05421680_11154 [Xenorhabdus mauleonii]
MNEDEIHRLKTEISERMEALIFLKDHIGCFPNNMDSTYTGLIFKKWRFIKSLENEIIFANGVQPAITESEFTLAFNDMS